MYRIKLSPFQKIFFNEWQIDPQRSDYNIVSDQFLHGTLCPDRLNAAIQKFASAYVLFNSRIEFIDNEPTWVSASYTAHLDFFGTPLSDKAIYDYVSQPFNLMQGPLYRFLLIQYTENKYRFVVVFHHILVSAFAVENGVFEVLMQDYQGDVAEFQYTHAEQIALLNTLASELSAKLNRHLQQNKKFWQTKLNEVEVLNLKFLHLEEKKQTQFNSVVKEYRFDLNETACMQTSQLSRKYEITPYLFGQIIFACLLYRYTGQKKFAINYPFSIKEGAEFIYGAQVNTSFIVYDFNHVNYFSDIAAQVRQFIKEVKNKGKCDHRYCPISEIIDIGNKDLLDVAFIQTNLKDILFKFNSIESVEVNQDFNIDLNNKLLFEQEIKDNTIKFRVKYRQDEINSDLLRSFIEAYRILYDAVLQNELEEATKKPLSAYSILSPENYHKIVYEWNATKAPYPSHKTIHALFEAQVQKTPQAIALRYENKQFTYEALNARANQLASYLRKQYDIQPNELIGVCLEKSEYLIIALLGILKSGAAYVPIDPSYPAKRIEYILNNIKAKVVLTTEAYLAKLKGVNTLALDQRHTEIILEKESKANPSICNQSQDLAYVIYTSGTTGMPKGVMIEHRNLVSFMTGFAQFPLNNQVSRNTLSVTHYVFDIFVLEFLLPLLSGYTLYLFDLLNPKTKIKIQDYDCVQVTPSTLELLVENIDDEMQALEGKYTVKVLIGGELVTAAAIHQLQKVATKLKQSEVNIHFEIINVYGPTETTIWSIAGMIDPDHLSSENKLGYPLKNECVYILDEALNPLPIGAVGEIHIGGSGVSRGYIHNEDLTHQKFIPNPFLEPHKMLYKTGDLGRWHSDGSIEFIGRKDFQVKLLGHRIELSEIESRLNAYPGIKQSLVLLVKSEEHAPHLIAYYTANKEISEEHLRMYLSEYLPHFMLPNKIAYLSKFPLTSSGKIDRNKLATYDVGTLSENAYVAPRNKLEAMICKIFSDSLGIEVGLYDDFFKLGGTSILAIQVVSKLRKDLSFSLEVGDIFKYRTVFQLVSNVQLSKKAHYGPELHQEHKKPVLSFAQERLWILSQYENANKAYNVPFIFKLKPECDRNILVKSLEAVINRHEILRTTIQKDTRGNAFPQVLPATLSSSGRRPEGLGKISLKTETFVEVIISNLLFPQIADSQKKLDSFLQKDIEHLFDLSQELPIKMSLYAYKNEYYLSLIFHHIAFDGWSGDILVRDLVEYYRYYSQDEKQPDSCSLPDISIQYTDFALWQRDYLKTKAISEQVKFWEKKLQYYEPLNLPIDKQRPMVFNYTGKTITFSLSSKLSTDLRACAKALGISLYSLMLSAFYLLLRIYSNQNDIALGTMVSNRHYKNVDNLVGFFVNMLPLCQKIQSDLKLTDFAHAVFDEIIEAQQNQDLPFEKLIEKLNFSKDLSKHPIFQVLFGVQNFGLGYEDVLLSYPHTRLCRTAKFDLSLVFNNGSEKLSGMLEYETSLFEEETIRNYIETYQIILKQLSQIKNPKFEEKRIRDLNYLDNQDYQKIVVDCNNTYCKYNLNKTIHQLFEEQVEKTPDNIALVYEGKMLTYKELNQAANKLAYNLKDHYKIRPDDLVALFLDRSENLIIAILAVLKSGGAYVPIDPNCPDSRMQSILKDTEPKLLLIDSVHTKRFSNNPIYYKYNFFSLKPYSKKIIDGELEKYSKNLENEVASGNLAYVIYTSGTTGNPKGVLQQHNSVTQLFDSTEALFGFNDKDVWALFHSYVFDFSVWEIWGALFHGGKLLIPTSAQIQDFEIFYELCKNEKLSVLNQTPSAFYIFSQIAIQKPISEQLNALRYVVFGGEALNFKKLQPWVDYYGDKKPQLINMYGITETTVHVTYKSIDRKDLEMGSCIGKPLPDQVAYILDENQTPVPVGAVGELYIGGARLARAYLNQPELTAQKFIQNPFIKDNSKGIDNRLYKTGDLAKYTLDGDIEYIGRKDQQVKIRGYRIELKEIENVLNCYKDIQQCAVILMPRYDFEMKYEDKYIVGYYARKIEVNPLDSLNLIHNWNEIYDVTYARLDNNFKSGFVGWNSSYTGKPILLEQMYEWRDETVYKIDQLPYKRIIEIGSGSGLLLFKLIGKCEHYYAFDFSKSAIEYLRDTIKNLGFDKKVESFVASADKISFKNFFGEYDTLIMNSVIQYFPSLEYIENIIMNAILNMNGSGQIFIGDVRDFRLLECFAYSVVNFKKGMVDISDIEYFKIKEKELLISPEYFLSLKMKFSSISSIELLPKLGDAINEMNSYRYDVILYIKNTNNDAIRTIKNEQFKKTVNMENVLKEGNQQELLIKYPNYRIIKDYIGYKNVYHIECDIDVKNVANLLSIQQLVHFFDKYDYKIKLYLDVENPLYFNIIACKNIEPKNIEIDYTTINLNQNHFSNNPLRNMMLMDLQYTEALREYLRSQLPSYMVPQYLIPIDRIPVNINGKLDYDSLPKPQYNVSDNYVPPHSKLEKSLCKIFAQFLNIEESKISIRDNFFQMGGNSLLAIKLVYKINSQFKCKLQVVDVFTRNTIQELALYLSDVKSNSDCVTHLNRVDNKLNMFMVHPAFASSEVYTELARKFSDQYSCYGLDNYNLKHNQKIEDIKELAEKYLSTVRYIRVQTDQEKEPYVFLGWSLGGQIALHMASILEQNGEKDIYLILIDSVYPDRAFSTLLSQVVLDQTQLRTFTQEIGLDPRYMTKVKNNFPYDLKLSFQGTSIKLKHSKLLLFKAMKKESFVFLKNYKPLKEYVGHLAYNNLDKAIDKQNIHLVKLENSNHFNLLEQDELIYENTVSFIDK